MKINDAIWGALLLLLSVAILIHIQSFPNIPGQKVGPSLFPGFIAVALGTCALILIFTGIAAHRRGSEQSPWVGSEPWMRSPRHILALSLVIGVNVFYILVVDRLGFIPTGVIYLAALFAVFGVTARWILPLAMVVTLVIHYSFYKLLKVPLPWGLLERFAW
jgi:putative tricarboxylic transport membrane protein